MAVSQRSLRLLPWATGDNASKSSLSASHTPPACLKLHWAESRSFDRVVIRNPPRNQSTSTRRALTVTATDRTAQDPQRDRRVQIHTGSAFFLAQEFAPMQPVKQETVVESFFDSCAAASFQHEAELRAYFSGSFPNISKNSGNLRRNHAMCSTGVRIK